MARTVAAPWKKRLSDLQKQVRMLEDDLRKRSDQVAPVRERWRQRWERARRGEQTTATYESWRDESLTQVAVAWVLSCVFVRTLEDNDLLGEVHLAGEGPRLPLAFEAHEAFFRRHPTATDREYLQEVFRTVATLPAMEPLLGPRHNPLWDADFAPDGTPAPLGEANLSPSGDAAKALLEFWQQRDPATGRLLRSFRPEGSSKGSPDDAPALDTRFLGDLYQDLSESARKRFALLQTPDFVEAFILDRTLEPAIDEFGLEKVRMIDPTCGSGHFLLGGFHRLLGHWREQDPGTNPVVLAQRALDGVHGVDLNPFAVACARFRLTVAALQACGLSRLKDAPGFTVHVASGDSLLHGRRHDRYGQMVLPTHALADWLPQPYAVGDYREATDILGRQYHAVVGNPPYITDQDAAHREVVRRAYESCHMKFSLGVPFTERFFDLAVSETASERAGFVGLITTNSFMKREFGKVLIEKILPDVDLTHVLDTSGAYIPGHGTPTVILFGRNRPPVAGTVRAALGIRGEPGTPEDPAQGVVWRSITTLLDTPGAQDAFITIADLPRPTLAHHPWSLGGGGAGDLKAVIEAHCPSTIARMTESVGITCFTLEDDVYLVPPAVATRARVPRSLTREMVVGDSLRDWAQQPCDVAVFPYDGDFRAGLVDRNLENFLWPFKTNLANSVLFGGKTKTQGGLEWFEYGRLTHSKLRTPLSITYAEVATHNHFVLDRGGKVFNRTAPVIKLPPGASEDDHLALLGLLNSSVACFWMKMSCFNKGATASEGVLQDDPEKFRLN